MPVRDGDGGLVAKLYLTLSTPWIVACQAPLSLGFTRQEYWSGLPFPSPGIFSTQGSNLSILYCRWSPALNMDSFFFFLDERGFFTGLSHQGKPLPWVAYYAFSQDLLRSTWQTELCIFTLYSMMIWETYTLWIDTTTKMINTSITSHS